LQKLLPIEDVRRGGLDAMMGGRGSDGVHIVAEVGREKAVDVKHRDEKNDSFEYSEYSTNC
jgi:hypothetical protein